MVERTRRRLPGLLAVLTVLAVSCGDDGGGGPVSGDGGDEAATAEPVSYAGRGPYAVGEVDLQLDPEHAVAVFYPVAPDDVATDAEPYSYSGDTIFGPEIASVLPGSLAGTISPDDTWVDQPASDDGPFPVVLHSHGASGNLRFSNLHNAHVASWGYTVVAVDHPERGVAAALGDFGGGGDDDERDFSDANLDTEQLLAGLDLALAEAESVGSSLAGALDGAQVAAEGHSAGGSASGAAAYDEQIDLWIGQAPGGPVPPDIDLEDYLIAEEGDDGETQQRIDTEAIRADVEPPDVASMIIAAEGDTVIELDGITDTYDWLAEPKRLAVIAESGHAVFVDPCLNIRAEGGLSEFVAALGLNPDDVPLIELGENGCLPDEISPEEVWPLIDHLTVAQLEAVFGDVSVGEASLDREYLDEIFPGLLADYRAG